MMEFTFGDEIFRSAFNNDKTPKISYGLRFPEACLRHCKDTFSSSRVYIICSKTLSEKTDALQRLKAALGSRVAGVRIGINPHTPIAQVLEVVNDAQGLDVDCLVTLGAGSLTDAAKLVRLALANSAVTEDDLNKLMGTAKENPDRQEHINAPRIPLIHIPTSLSGGEYQALAGGTESKGHSKKLWTCEKVNPELVIQDPELCLTTPSWVWLSTGIRSVDHCVETLCSLQSNEEADALAKLGLQQLVTGLLESKKNPESLQARHLCQQGVVSAMYAVSTGVPLGASHAIGHQLGPLGVGHGETSCILLPAVCKFNLKHKANLSQQAVTREVLLEQNDVKQLVEIKGLEEGDLDLGDLLDIVIAELGMPRTLEDVGIGKDSLVTLARNSLGDIWIRTNAVPITKEAQVREILEQCRRK
jgi:alcohol dehydrogenase class IV